MVGAELLEKAPLSEALERVANTIKAKPNDSAARTFFFELLSLNGELDRATKQLELLATMTGDVGAGANVYLGALAAEQERRRFFHGGPRPRVLGGLSYSSGYLEAVEHYAAGNSKVAAEGLEAAAEIERPLRGTLNGSAIEGLNDSNDLTAPFLEVVMDGHLTWISWESIQSLSIPEPR